MGLTAVRCSMRSLFIAGTGTAIGKTTTAVALASGVTNLRVGYWKPISSGLPSDSDIVARHASSTTILPSSFAYHTPISPHAAAKLENRPAADLTTLSERLDCIQADGQFDLLLIEAAGGLLVPFNDELHTWLDFLHCRPELSIILVAASGLGTINHTSLSLRCLRDSGFEVAAIVMCGAPFHDNATIISRLASNIPIHSLADCVDLSASMQWAEQSQRLASFITTQLDRGEGDSDVWRDYDQRYVWHPFTCYRDRVVPRAIRGARGVWLETVDGRRLIDGISSWWTSNIGHGRPEIAYNCAAQIRQCDHVAFAGLAHAPAARLAHKVMELSDNDFSRVFFSDNGSTAVEIALKIAFQYQRNCGQMQRNTFVTLRGGYHGDTVGAMSLGGLDRFRAEFAPLLFETLCLSPVTSHPSYVCPEGERGLAGNLVACQELIEKRRDSICAIIVEPLVQGAAGMLMQAEEWLQAIGRLAVEYDIPLIFDEVFTAFGRCGGTFAYQRAGVVPDIVCVAKGLTGGVLPLGLTLSRAKFFQSFVAADCAFMHGHTFTANPVVCRAALVALAIAQKENINMCALSLEGKFRDWVSCHQRRLINPRVLGGILAFEVRDNRVAQDFVSIAAEYNLFLRPLGNVIYFVPPLVINAEELSIAMHALERGLREVT